jgi:hypothetical protein
MHVIAIGPVHVARHTMFGRSEAAADRATLLRIAHHERLAALKDRPAPGALRVGAASAVNHRKF